MTSSTHWLSTSCVCLILWCSCNCLQDKSIILYPYNYSPHSHAGSNSGEFCCRSHVSLMQVVSRGMDDSLYMSVAGDVPKLIPLLSTFCSLYYHMILTLHDSSFKSSAADSGESSHSANNTQPCCHKLATCTWFAIWMWQDAFHPLFCAHQVKCLR